LRALVTISNQSKVVLVTVASLPIFEIATIYLKLEDCVRLKVL
jgi:hypothetical protein